MDKNKICEALYALPQGVVERRRKSLLVPVSLLLAGAALIVLNSYLSDRLSDDVRSALVFIGGVVAIVGVFMTLGRMLGTSGAPFHRASKAYLRYEELFFDQKCLADVAKCVNEGELTRLRTIERSQVPAVAVALYSTREGAFAAMQAFEYADLEYRPLTELRIVEK